MPRSTPTSARAQRPGIRQAFGNDLAGAALLSGVAGYVDTAGFLALYGLFTAHVTGDLVTAGVVVAERLRTGAATRLAMIPIFMVSVAATSLFARRQKRLGKEPLTALLAVMTLALAVFGATGVALRNWACAPDDWAVAITGATGVVAMAIQNTLMRDALSSFCPTTIMTGNLTQVTIDLVDLFIPVPPVDAADARAQRREARRRLQRFGIPLLGFMIGGALGAILTHALGLWSIALPTAAVGALTGVAWHVARSTASALAQEEQARSTPRLSGIQRREEAAPTGTVSGAPPSTRHASGTQLVAMQVPETKRLVLPESGTYAKVRGVTPVEAPDSNRSAPDRRRAQ